MSCFSKCERKEVGESCERRRYGLTQTFPSSPTGKQALHPADGGHEMGGWGSRAVGCQSSLVPLCRAGILRVTLVPNGGHGVGVCFGLAGLYASCV